MDNKSGVGRMGKNIASKEGGSPKTRIREPQANGNSQSISAVSSGWEGLVPRRVLQAPGEEGVMCASGFTEQGKRERSEKSRRKKD